MELFNKTSIQQDDELAKKRSILTLFDTPN